ncbi:MAG: hypothetical protein Q7J82_06655 [Coriobacteriia bacterium]|nr:hypothetical protein [Coriobacteriia bacterium]
MKRIGKTAALAAMMMMVPASAYAAGLADTSLVTGTKELIADATVIITGLLAAIAALVLLVLFVKSFFASDEHEKAATNRKMRGVAIGFAVALSVSGLLAAITSYFQ